MTRPLGAAALCVVLGCAGPGASTGGSAAPAVSAPVRTAPDTSTTLIPAGFGTLKQDDIAIVLEPNGVHVTAIPLDEPVIRTLAPDSYRALEARLDSKRTQVAQRAAMHGVRTPRVWYVVFSGLTADARFVPTDITVTSGGRDFRPFDVIPLSAGFGEQRLQPRETQSGLLLFDEAVDVAQPITVTTGTDRNTDWEVILHRLDAERAAIRSRASRAPRR
jgi:hypothetical protein